ncbi:unnamed protein product, partial [marine sediment metagenome]
GLPGEAAIAIDFLDTLRDALWETYREHFTGMHYEAYDNAIRDVNQYEFEFNDDIPF